MTAGKKLTGSDATRARPGLSLERFATTAHADLRFAPLNVFLLVAVFAVGLAIHLTSHSFSVTAVGLGLGSALVLAVCIRLTQVWETVVILGTADCLLIYLALRPTSAILPAVESMGLGALGGLTAFGQTAAADEVERAELSTEEKAGPAGAGES